MNIKRLICKIKFYFSKELISAFIDGALDAASENRVKRLIAQCPEAKAYMEQLLNLDSKLKAIPSLVPPEAIKQKVNSAIINQGSVMIKNTGKEQFPFKEWVYIVSSAFVVILVVTMFFSLKRYSNGIKQADTMFASMDMYEHMDLYKHMDMIEHLQEIMAIKEARGNPTGRNK